MHSVPYEMSDEELQIFLGKFREICGIIDGTPEHLVLPLLVRLAVGTHLEQKGFTKGESTTHLAHSLVTEITELLVSKTIRHITESN